MQLTIFSRVTLGYLSIFIIMGALNGYTVLKLYHLNRETTRIINVDQQVLDLRKKMADAILSQMAYDKKFIITKDPSFQIHARAAEVDFAAHLDAALSLADTTSLKDPLNRIKLRFEEYRTLIEGEVNAAGKHSPQGKQADGQKEDIIEAILDELKTLEVASQGEIISGMNRLREGGSSAGNLALIMWSMALLVVIAISLLTTRSITKPLTLLMNKTHEISKGSFKGDLNIVSPPELAKLTTAFNLMCERLRTVDTLKSDFFSTMSHELRTPLASIKEGIGLLQDGAGGPITDKQDRLLIILSEETRRLIDLVNSLLDLSKMEAGMMVYRFDREDFVPLIRKVGIEMAPLIEAKHIHLEETIAPNLPHIRIDRERMLQALRNLLGNAIKFTPEKGQIRIECRVGDRGFEFSVSDTGPGIPTENLEAIFEKFHQPPVKSSAWMKGTGLGLAIVKHIIAAHGGEIWAESQQGKGSSFISVLPL